MKKTLLALLLAVPLLADTPDNWGGTCQVSFSSHLPYTTTCRTYDQSPYGITPGYWNNWYVQIDYVPYGWFDVFKPRIAEWVRAEALADGSMRFNALLEGTVVITPFDPTISARNSAHVSADSRAQHIEVTAYDSIGALIHIDEPVGETTNNGTTPIYSWLLLNVQAHQIYGKVGAAR